MIYYLVTKKGRSGMMNYLKYRGHDLADRINIVLYQDLYRLHNLEPGTYIFAELEQLSMLQRDIATQLWGKLSQSGSEVKLLNHPSRVMYRYELLRKLNDLGKNRFRVVQASESWPSFRFPVFLREENNHTGSLTNLLITRKDLEEAIISKIILGYPFHNLLIVEFCDTSDETGLFRKYSAFKVGEKIIPRYLNFSRHWVVKRGSFEREKLPEALAYFEQNPHEEWLRAVFSLAQIDYGRVDYSLLGDQPQIWEINLNPSFGRMRSLKKWTSKTADGASLFLRAKEIFYNQFRTALEGIDCKQSEGQEIQIALLPKELRRFKPMRRQKFLDVYYRFMLTRRPPFHLLRHAIELIANTLSSIVLKIFPVWARKKISA